MANITHVDALINFSAKIIQKIAASQEVVGLMLNDPDILMTSEAALNIYDDLYDYDYVDDTIDGDKALIMVDVDMLRQSSPTMSDYEIYVQVVCTKQYMKLTPSLFKGVRGNRRDNIVRYIDLLLNGSKEFGIGKLELKRVNTAVVPEKLTSKLLTYKVVDFAQDRTKLPV